MKRIILYVIVLLTALSCREKAEYDQTLGLLSEYNVISADGGSTQVPVFSNTSWTVEMDREVSWASIDRFSGTKSGYLVFDWEINYGRSRRVILVFKAGGETRTLNMFQSPRYEDSKCVMNLTYDSPQITATSEGKTVELDFDTNLVYNLDEMYLNLTYPAGEEPVTPWIILKSLTKDKVIVEIASNTTGKDRTANLRVSHTDAGAYYDSTEGTTIDSNPIKVVQTK